MRGADEPIFLPDEDEGPGASKGWRPLVIASIIGGTALAVCVLCAGLLAFSFSKLMEQIRGHEVAMPPVESESLEERRQDVTSAFAAEEVGVYPDELARIRRLFDKIIASTASDDQIAFAELIDLDRMWLQLKKSGMIRSLRSREDAAARDWLEGQITLPGEWKRYHLACVRRTGDPREVIVYGYFWESDLYPAEVRWWLVRQGAEWKIYDWQMLELGPRESYEEAVYYRYSDDPRLEEHYQIQWDIVEAESLRDAYEFDRAIEVLRRAEKRPMLPELADQMHVQLAYAWCRAGRYREALAACRRVRVPDATPGAHFGQATAYRGLNRLDKGLAALDRYEHAMGKTPGVNSMRAEILDAAERYSESIPHWKAVLKLEPECRDALRSLGLSLPADRKDELAEFINRADEPAALAEELAGWYAAMRDVAAVGALRRIVDEHVPGTPAAIVVRAQEQAARGDLVAAANAYLEAYRAEEDDEAKQSRLHAFLDEMTSAGKALDAYRGAPDKPAAFQYLAAGYEYGEGSVDERTLDRLIEEHRPEHGNDPRLRLYAGVRAGEGGDHEGALREYESGLKAADHEDEIVAELRSQKRFALVELGRALEAYHAAEDPEEAFHDIASTLRWRRSTDDLKSLIAAHRRTHPRDPRLDYYDAAVALQDGRADETDLLLAKAERQFAEGWPRQQCRNERIDLRLKDGQIAEAYQLAPSDETFEFITSRLTSQNDSERIATVVDLHRARYPASPLAAAWDAELCWRAADDRGVVERLVPWPEVFSKDPEPAANFQLEEKLVRSLLRLKEIDAAEREARRIYDLDANPFPMLLVEATRNRRAEVERYLSEYRPSPWQLQWLYTDEDIGPILRSEEYRDLRASHPPGVPVRTSDSGVVMLFARPPAWEPERVREMAAVVLGEGLTMDLVEAEVSPETTDVFLVGKGRRQYLISRGTDRYSSDVGDAKRLVRDGTLQEALESHRGWIAVKALSGNGAKSDVDEASTGLLAAAFLNEDCKAVYFGDTRTLLPNDDATRSMLMKPLKDAPFAPADERIWLFRSAENSDEDVADSPLDSPKLAEFLSALARRSPGDSFEVQIAIHAGHAVERPWLDVQRHEQTRSGLSRFIAAPSGPSRLQPLLVPGEPVVVDEYSLVGWRFTRNGETRASRDRRVTDEAATAEKPTIP